MPIFQRSAGDRLDWQRWIKLARLGIEEQHDRDALTARFQLEDLSIIIGQRDVRSWLPNESVAAACHVGDVAPEQGLDGGGTGVKE